MNGDLEFNNKIYQAWLNSTTELVYFKDLEGRYTAVSRATLELAGLSRYEEMVGKFDFELYPPENAKSFIAQDRIVMNTGETVVDTDWVDHPTKGRILIDCVKSPLFDETGKIIGMQGVSRDITERFKLRQQLEEHTSKLQVILDNIPCAIWIKSKMNTYIMVNSEYERFYDVSRKDIIGTNVNALMDKHRLFEYDDIQILGVMDRAVMEEGLTKELFVETRPHHITNRRKHIKIVKSPIISSSGECMGLIGISYELGDD
ncbi:PAS domain-containing protein [bacterium]|nr:PAS domain-containing protein [bacterium]